MNFQVWHLHLEFVAVNFEYEVQRAVAVREASPH